MERTITVGGMHCRSCEMLLTDSIGEIDGVDKVSADSKKGIVIVDCRDEIVLEAVRKTIEKEGYKVLM